MPLMNAKTFLSACTAVAAQTDGLIKLVPKGSFAPQDGRTDTGVDYWTMTAELAEELIAEMDGKQTELVVDYEHATLKSAENGRPNPAAGWIRRCVWDDEQGLMGEVQWTDRARQMIADKEYRYLSPVLIYDEAGNVRGLHSAALTNAPALDGMALAELSRQNFPDQPPTKKEASMNKEALIKLFGLPADADDAAVEAAVAAWQDKTGGKTLDEYLAEAAKPAGKQDVPSDGKEAGQDTDKGVKDAAADGEVAELKQQLAALSRQVNALQTAGDSEKLIIAALSDGRLLPHQEAAARKLAAQDPESFQYLIQGSLKLAALSSTQTGGKAAGTQAAVLSDIERAAADACGLSYEDYAKAKDEA